MKRRIDPEQTFLEAGHLDEIRATVDWRALFEGLGLRRAERKSKPMDWWAFSPFHDEKTPSFHMSPGGIWYDFSIGEGGGPIELVQRLQNCDCYEAGRYILDRGWANSSAERSPSRQRSAQTRRKVSQMVGRSSDFPGNSEEFQNDPIRQDLIRLCTDHPEFAARGVSEETRNALGIGFLPQGRSPMKGRIVFQIADARSGESGELERVILSHIGRAVGEDRQPKYLFYDGFHKSAELYGQEILSLDEAAAEQARQTGALLLTEGPFDLAKAYEAGLRNAVASLGSRLSDQQARKLRDFSETLGVSRVVVVYDRDDAGQAGAAKAAELLQSFGLEPRIFDWAAPVGRTRKGPAHIPPTLQDLGDMSAEQIAWLRQRGLL